MTLAIIAAIIWVLTVPLLIAVVAYAAGCDDHLDR